MTGERAGQAGTNRTAVECNLNEFIQPTTVVLGLKKTVYQTSFIIKTL